MTNNEPYNAITMHDYEVHGIGANFLSSVTDAVARESVLQAAGVLTEDVLGSILAEPEVLGIRVSPYGDVVMEGMSGLPLAGKDQVDAEKPSLDVREKDEESDASAAVYGLIPGPEAFTKTYASSSADGAEMNDYQAERPTQDKETPGQITNSGVRVTEGPIGYTAFRKLKDNDNLVVRRGRPVDGKQIVHSKTVQEKKVKTRKKPQLRTRTDSVLQPTLNKLADFRLTKARRSIDDALADQQQPTKVSRTGQNSSIDDAVDNTFTTDQPPKFPGESDASSEQCQSTEDTSIQRVFSTYELIEQILLQSDVYTVLHAQRVNKTFRHIVHRSTKLQQKLFFKRTTPSEKTGKISWNPFFLRRDVADTYIWTVYQDSSSLMSEHAELQLPHPHSRGDANASWRRMLLCQDALDGSLFLDMEYRDSGIEWLPYLREFKLSLTAGKLSP